MRFPLAQLLHLSTSSGLAQVLRAAAATAAPGSYTGIFAHLSRREQPLVSLRGFGPGRHGLVPPHMEPALPASGSPPRGGAGQRRVEQSLLKLLRVTSSSAVDRSPGSGDLCGTHMCAGSDSSRRFCSRRNIGSKAAEQLGGSAEAQQASERGQAPAGQPADGAAAAAELAGIHGRTGAPAEASVDADAAAATTMGSVAVQEDSGYHTPTFDTPKEEEEALDKLRQDMDAIMHVRVSPPVCRCPCACAAHTQAQTSCHCRLHICAARCFQQVGRLASASVSAMTSITEPS